MHKLPYRHSSVGLHSLHTHGPGSLWNDCRNRICLDMEYPDLMHKPKNNVCTYDESDIESLPECILQYIPINIKSCNAHATPSLEMPLFFLRWHSAFLLLKNGKRIVWGIIGNFGL